MHEPYVTTPSVCCYLYFIKFLGSPDVSLVICAGTVCKAKYSISSLHCKDARDYRWDIIVLVLGYLGKSAFLDRSSGIHSHSRRSSLLDSDSLPKWHNPSCWGLNLDYSCRHDGLLFLDWDADVPIWCFLGIYASCPFTKINRRNSRLQRLQTL